MADEVSEASIVLLGGIGFIITLFYLVNSQGKLVVQNTWSTITKAVSIFLAVLTFNVSNAALESVLAMEDPVDGSPPDPKNIMVSGVVLLCWWIFFVLIIFFAKGSLLHLKAYGMIGGHILGFNAVKFFGQIAISERFRTANMMFLEILLYPAAMFLLFLPTGILRKSCQGKISKEDEDRWHEQSADTGTDFLCVGWASLIALWIRTLILGQCPTIYEARARPYDDQYVLGGVAFAIVVSASILTSLSSKLAAKYSQLMEILSTTVSITASMSAMVAIHWHFHGRYGDTLMCKMHIALTISILAIAFVFILSMVVDHCGLDSTLLRGVFTAICLALGASWEKTFDKALGGMPHPHWSAVMLVLCVFPAWMVYMVPKSDGDLKKAMSKRLSEGGLPVTAVCCDDGLYNSDESDDEDEESADEPKGPNVRTLSGR